MNNVSFHPCNTRFDRALGILGLLRLAVGLAACSSDQVSLGDRQVPLDGPVEAACDGGVVIGSVEVTTQEQIDALAGCEEVVGDLAIRGELDLRPLASLRIVRGSLEITPERYMSEPRASSLQGLESLEQVSNLALSWLGDADLSPLAALTRVQLDPLNPSTAGGNISIDNCSRLTDLAGLGGLQQWARLDLQNNESMSSMRGIGMPAGEAHLRAIEMPALRDISPFALLRSMGSLSLWDTGIQSLEELNLEYLDTLDLRENAALADLDGLNGLRRLSTLILYNNAALQQLPVMPELRTLRRVQIVSNPELRSIPQYAAGVPDTQIGLGSWPASPANNPDTVPLFTFQVFEVGNNAKLAHLSLPSGLQHGQYVGIYDNPSLTELDMSSVEKLDMLSLRNNVALPGVAIDALQTVDDLIVTGNTALPESTFDDVATFTRDMSGNAAGDAP